MLKSKEWPLIVFTLLTQAAVGLFSMVPVIQEILGAQAPENLQDSFARWSLLITLLMLVIGTGVAASHLGQRSKAHRAISNLSSSYLSREMLLGGLFGGSTGFLTLLVFLQVGEGFVQTIISFAGLAIGWSLIFTISKVYLIRTVPAWNSPATPISFFLTTLLLGLVSSVFILMLVSIQSDNLQHRFVANFTQSTSTTITILLSAQLITFLSNLIGLSRRGRAALTSMQAIYVTHRMLFVLRIVLVIVNLALLLAIVGESVTYVETTQLLLVIGIALALIWAGELVGRFLFYESHHRIGL